MALVSTSCKLDDVKKVTGVTGNYRVQYYCSSFHHPGFHFPNFLSIFLGFMTMLYQLLMFQSAMCRREQWLDRNSDECNIFF
jgi:hypothetical protein